jgi:hypothetical protein
VRPLGVAALGLALPVSRRDPFGGVSLGRVALGWNIAPLLR